MPGDIVIAKRTEHLGIQTFDGDPGPFAFFNIVTCPEGQENEISKTRTHSFFFIVVDDDVIDTPLRKIISGPTEIGLCDTLRLHTAFTSGILGSMTWEWELPDDIKNTTECVIDTNKSILEIKPSCFIQNPTNEIWKLFTFTLTAERSLKRERSVKNFIVNRTRLSYPKFRYL